MIKAKSAPYLARGKPARRPQLRNEDDHTIVSVYGAEYRGIVQYYLLAGNVARLYRLHWVMETSLLKTLADKHRSSVMKMARKHKAAWGYSCKRTNFERWMPSELVPGPCPGSNPSAASLLSWVSPVR